jgi:MFS transporter, DHA3 family, macrolide efflux protein
MAAIARARTGYGALFRHPGYRRLWIANAISLIGDAITRIALPVYVYRLTGSAAALGGTVVLQSFAASVIGLTCGVFVDRLSRKGILTLVPIVQAAIVALLPLTAALWQVLLITLIASGLAIFTGTARFAAIPDIVGPALMPYAAASGQISTQAMNVIGPSIGGLLVALVGVRTAFLLDAATFLAAAALVATVAIPRPSLSGAAIPLRADLLTGLRYIWSRPVVQFLVFGDVAGDVGYTTMLVLSVALVEGVLNHGSAIFGLLIAAHAAGYVASALIATRLANRPGRMRYWVVGGLAVAGAGLLVAALVPTLVGAFIGWIMLGAGTAPAWTLQSVLWARLVPSEIRGRTGAVANAAASIVQLASAGAIGSAAATFGTRAAIGGAGLMQILAICAAITLLRHGWHAMRDA